MAGGGAVFGPGLVVADVDGVGGGGGAVGRYGGRCCVGIGDVLVTAGSAVS